MSVLSCSRNGCNNIMCDTYVDGVGYICNSCQHEFKHYVMKKLTHDFPSDLELKLLLMVFIETDGESYLVETSNCVDMFFRQYTNF